MDEIFDVIIIFLYFSFDSYVNINLFEEFYFQNGDIDLQFLKKKIKVIV